MADDWVDDEPVPVSGGLAAPVPTLAELPEIKLFGKWSCEEVNISDMSLQVRETDQPLKRKLSSFGEATNDAHLESSAVCTMTT